jgi:hypothetical protein
MENLFNFFTLEPFLHEIFSFLNIKDLFVLRSLNHEIHNTSSFIFFYSKLKKKTRFKFHSKHELSMQFNTKFKDLIFLEPIHLSSENMNEYYIALRDLFKFHNKLVIPHFIDLIKSQENNYHSLLKIQQNVYKLKSILKGMNKFELLDSLQLEPIFVSSTDEANQSIWEPILNDDKFWSSKGSITSEGNEYIIFKFTKIVSLVTGFSIKSFKATFHDNDPIYAPKAIKLSIGFTPEKFHFCTDIIPLPNTNEPLTFFFLPYYILGTYIRIDLIGKYQIQEIDYRYYHAIQKISVYGKDIKSINSEGLNTLVYKYLRSNDLLNFEYICCLQSKESALKSHFYEILNKEFAELINTIFNENIRKDESLWIPAFQKLSEFINENCLFMLYHPKLIETVTLISKYKAFLGIHKKVLVKNESIMYKRYSDFDFLLFNYASFSQFGLHGESIYFQFYDDDFTVTQMKILNSYKTPSINTELKYLLYDGLIESFNFNNDYNVIMKILLKNEFKMMPNSTKFIDKTKLSLLLESIYRKLDISPIIFLNKIVKQIYSNELNVYCCFTFYTILIRILVNNNIYSDEIIDVLSTLIM